MPNTMLSYIVKNVLTIYILISFLIAMTKIPGNSHLKEGKEGLFWHIVPRDDNHHGIPTGAGGNWLQSGNREQSLAQFQLNSQV